MLKLAYAYTIGIAFVIWQGNRYLLFSLRSYFDWFNRPVRKIIALTSTLIIMICVIFITHVYETVSR